MTEVVFATCEQQPLLTSDDRVLADALSKLGLTAIALPWTEIDPHAIADAPPILLRSTWDYHRLPTMFRAWLEALQAFGRPVWNPAAIAKDNVDKIYLRDLEARGVTIPRTQWLEHIDADVIRRTLDEQHWTAAMLKPRIAATAYGTFVVDRTSTLTDVELAPARASGALLQELVPQVASSGELSLIYFDGTFSHAVVKRAANGDFRVQKDFGGTVAAVTATDDQRVFADRVMMQVPSNCLYARVDIVDAARGPLLMELEMIEPELYFMYVPEAADRLARLIAQRLQEFQGSQGF